VQRLVGLQGLWRGFKACGVGYATIITKVATREACYWSHVWTDVNPTNIVNRISTGGRGSTLHPSGQGGWVKSSTVPMLTSALSKDSLVSRGGGGGGGHRADADKCTIQ
jgi:hypothetical protein